MFYCLYFNYYAATSAAATALLDAIVIPTQLVVDVQTHIKVIFAARAVS